MEAGEKICPTCGTSYRPQALRCADCGTELVDAAGFEGVAPPPPVDFEGLECVRATEPRWAEGLRDALEGAGIEGHMAAVDDGGGNLRVGVFVDPSDLERAYELDAEFARGHLGLGDDAPRAGQCGICGAALASSDQELCASLQRRAGIAPRRGWGCQSPPGGRR